MKKTIALLLSSSVFWSSAFAITDVAPDKPAVAPVSSQTASLTPDLKTSKDAAAAATALASDLALRPYGSLLFNGQFSGEQFTGFNPDYQIATGDRISVRIWGALSFEQTLTVDPQGNVFIPNVGPVQVRGIKNGELNAAVAQRAATIFRNNVGIYASLEAAQPVKVFVTGAVVAPGLYAGVSADSILRFLDKAGGVDAVRGAYTDVKLQRRGVTRATFNLYDFLANGRIESVQLQDGDVLLVAPRQAAVRIQGSVMNQNIFELAGRTQLSEMLSLARPTPGATHALVTRQAAARRSSEVIPLRDAATVTLTDGDTVELTTEQQAANITVRVQGAHAGAQSVVLPYGASLGSVLQQLRTNEQSNMAAVQIYRKSVAERQKKAIDVQLSYLQQKVLTTSSDTREESELRKTEADLVLRFIEHARQVQPKGQVILPADSDKSNVILEEGDVVFIPEKSSLVLVHGEVPFPNAVAWTAGKDADYYVQQVGGYTKGARHAQVLVIRADGSAAQASEVGKLQAGDELYVLPRAEGKNIEVARGLTELMFRIAFVAKVALGL